MILPGVGSFDTGMKNIKKDNILNTIEMKVKKKLTPILGICLGMQMMFNKSEEKEKGLGWVNGEVKKFKFKDLKVPHMGWNNIKIKNECRLTKNLDNNTKFYFVHSYFRFC